MTEPTIVTRRILLVGASAEIDLRSDFSRVLGALQDTVRRNLDSVSNKAFPIRMVGLWLPHGDGTDESSQAMRRYLAGVEVTSVGSVPSGLAAVELPRSKFAVFREKKRGTVSRFAYTEWLPSSGYVLNEDLMGDLEIYDDTQRCGPDDECDILLPIRARGQR